MKIVIIGSGNVATHLAKALYAANMQVVQVWSAHYQNASLLANEVNAEAIEHMAQLDQTADVCLIAVKDDAIEEVVNQLKGFKGLIAHTSGAISLEVFNEGFESYGVFYPLQTFSKTKEVDFGNIPICIEANIGTALGKLKVIGDKLSRTVVTVDSDKRKILHLAAVFACNFTNHLYALADEILTSHQLDFDMLRPLIGETAAKVQHALPINVQTGPAIRNDELTMEKHEALLIEQPQLLEIYKTLSESIKKTR